jgi:peroxiredoxin/DNA-binding transcriptional MerR regulator
MRIGELARRAGVSQKAVRYYERLGLVVPGRSGNGYRDYDESHLRVVAEIRDLAASGIAPGRAAPFVECLRTGHEHGDDCPAALAAYRDSIAEVDRVIASLAARRQRLVRKLEQGAARTDTKEPLAMTDFTTLPDNLPVPVDDGAADHLAGLPMPALSLQASDGQRVDLAATGPGPGPGRTIIYIYPLTGRPGVDLPDGWDAIPGARGCSTEACDFRDHFADLQAAGAAHVWGLSSQDPDYQAEVVQRLRLPFTMLSDPEFTLADALNLPTFSAPGHPRLYSRLTIVARDGRIEHVFYPIFPPNTHAQQVLDWLRAHPAD